MHIAASGIFMYHNRCFRQVDGVTMGSPSDPQWLTSALQIWKPSLSVTALVSCLLPPYKDKDKDKDKDVFIGPKGICFTHDDDTNKRQAIPPIEIDL